MKEQWFNGKAYRLYRGERYFSRGTKRLHRVVWEFHNGPIPKNFHIHHVDHNPHNNVIENLSLINPYEHLMAHMTPSRRAVAKAWVNKIRPLTKKWHASKEGRAWHRAHGKATWVGRKLFKKKCAFCKKSYKTKVPSHSQYCHQNCKMKARRRRLHEQACQGR